MIAAGDPDRARLRRRAKRLACKISRLATPQERERCTRAMLEAVYSMLPPKIDGSHPLDAAHITQSMSGAPGDIDAA